MKGYDTPLRRLDPPRPNRSLLCLQPEFYQLPDGIGSSRLVLFGPSIDFSNDIGRDAGRYHRVAPRRWATALPFLVYLYF